MIIPCILPVIEAAGRFPAEKERVSPAHESGVLLTSECRAADPNAARIIDAAGVLLYPKGSSGHVEQLLKSESRGQQFPRASEGL